MILKFPPAHYSFQHFISIFPDDSCDYIWKGVKPIDIRIIDAISP